MDFLETSPDLELDFKIPQITVKIQRSQRSMLELRINNSKPILINTRRNRTPSKAIDYLLLRIKKNKKEYPKVVGIDLSASEKRSTGWALMEGKRVQVKLLKTDKEIIETTTGVNPDLVSIDSPLGLPKGRDCTKDSCECRRFGITREAERILRHRGVFIFPSLIRSMQLLTERGIHLRKMFEKRGFPVIESYPGAAQDILRIIRKKVSLEDLKLGLESIGLTGEFAHNRNSHDELDAITSALVGYFYIAGEYEALGNKEEGYLIIPKLGKKSCR
jgi:predicted nuclease with RNAse H fold